MDTKELQKTLESARDLLEGELISYYHLGIKNDIERMHKEAVQDCVDRINISLEKLGPLEI